MGITRLDLLKGFISGLFALALGFFGLSFLFSDLGPGETWTSRFIGLAVLYLGSGFIIGYVNPKLWMIAGLTAWGALLLGIVALINVLIPE
jgi:hypothetical protein